MADRTPVGGLTGSDSVSLEDALSEVDRRLKALESGPAQPPVVTQSANVHPRQFVRVQAPPGGLRLLFPKASSTNRGQRVTLNFETTGPVTLQAIDGLVNGERSALNTSIGTYDAVSDGESGWNVAIGVSSSGSTPASSGALTTSNAEPYVTHAASSALTNARRGTDSTEIAFTTTTASVVSWVIRAASVVAGKLAAVTGRSAFIKAAAGAGALAEVAAGDDEFLGTSGTGSLGFRKVHNAALDSDVTWENVLARGATTGGNGDHPTWSNGDQARFDSDGTATYPTTGTLRASGELNFRATGSSDWRATGLTCTADSAAMNFTASLSSIGFTSATTMALTAGTSMTQKAALGNNFFMQAGYLRMYTGSASYVERLRIDPNGLWSIGSSFGTGSTGQVIRRTAGNNPPAWATLSIADVSSDFDWAGVLAHDPATDGNDPEISQGDALLFDGAGDGDYTGLTGDIQGNAGLLLQGDHFSAGVSSLDLGTASNPWAEINAPFFVVNVPSGFMALDPGFLRMTEQSASTPSMSAGRGLWWVKDDTPCVPYFTDDTNTDHELGYGKHRRSVDSSGGAVSALDWSSTDVWVFTASATISGNTGMRSGAEGVILAGSGVTVTLTHSSTLHCPGSKDLVITEREAVRLWHDSSTGTIYRCSGVAYPTFDANTPGVVPASSNSADEYLAGDGVWRTGGGSLIKRSFRNTADASWSLTPQSATTWFRATFVAGGGGGGGADAETDGEACAGSGGGAGGFSIQQFSITSGNITGAVGAGGSGGSVTGGNGGSGGNTSVTYDSSTVTATGGSGGAGTSAGAGGAVISASAIQGGTGGADGSGYGHNGGDGGNSFMFGYGSDQAFAAASGGQGAASFYGQGGRGGVVSGGAGTSTGGAGEASGSGGGGGARIVSSTGAATGAAGGGGAAGFVVVEEFTGPVPAEATVS